MRRACPCSPWSVFRDRRLPVAVLAGSLLALGACGGGGDGAPTQPQPAAVASITVTLSAASVRLGEPVTATATLRDAAGQSLTGRAITWASSVPTVATVDGAGAITTLAAGATTISATSEGRTGSATLTVLAPVVVTVSIVDGDRQQARAGTSVVVPPVVLARDAGGAPAPGIRLRFAVLSGGGSVGTAIVTTDASGRASPGTWTLGSALGEQQLEVGAADGTASVTAPVRINAMAVGPGEPVSYPVRSYPITITGAAVIDDTVTGMRFAFPAGGTGTFEVARVATGPTPPVSGALQFLASFVGNRPVELVAVAPAGGGADGYRWGFPQGAAAGGRWASNWWGLPALRARGDTTWFALHAPEPAASRTAVPGRWAAQLSYTRPVYAVAITAALQADFIKRDSVRALSQETIDWWIEQVPFEHTMRLRLRVADYPLSYSFGRGADSYYYYGYRSLWTASAYFNLDRTVRTVSRHEPSHYMTHMLVGDSRWGELTSTAPDSGHDLGVLVKISGVVGFRNSVVEDYAYIAEQLITGQVSNTDLRGGTRRNGFPVLAEPQRPEAVDFPSLEGFGAALMASLTRIGPDTLVTDDFATASQSRAPALGVTARQLLGVLAAGPRTVMELRDGLEPLAGGPVALAAVAEPIGWRYHGTGRVLDGTGNPVPGVTVASVVRVNGKDYATPVSSPSAADGRFTLPRIYPGASTLRVYRTRSGGGVDSANVKTLEVPWARPTPETVAIGDVVFDDFSHFTGFFVSVSGITAPNQLGFGPATCTSTFTITDQLQSSWTGTTTFPLTWDGPSFRAAGTTQYDVETGYTSGPIRVRYENGMSLNGMITGRTADTLRLTLQVTKSLKESEYSEDPVTREGRWVVRVHQTAQYGLQDFPVRALPTLLNGLLSGPAAVATFVPGWQFRYLSIVPDAPWITNQWDCSAYSLGAGTTVRVQLIPR